MAMAIMASSMPKFRVSRARIHIRMMVDMRATRTSAQVTDRMAHPLDWSPEGFGPNVSAFMVVKGQRSIIFGGLNHLMA